jgi:hypothetical protein
VIRNVVIHMNNEQPLMADLRGLPTASDACLMCTNLRYLNGKKPTFIDHIESWFLLPLGMVRFVEVPQASITDAERDEVLALPEGEILPSQQDTLDDDPIDFDSENELLRRMREV